MLCGDVLVFNGIFLMDLPEFGVSATGYFWGDFAFLSPAYLRNPILKPFFGEWSAKKNQQIFVILVVVILFWGDVRSLVATV